MSTPNESFAKFTETLNELAARNPVPSMLEAIERCKNSPRAQEHLQRFREILKMPPVPETDAAQSPDRALGG